MVGSLGIINLTTGTPVRLTANLPTKYVSNQNGVSVRIQACPDNAAPVYIGLAGMEASPTGPQLLGVIAKPVSATTGPFDFFYLDIQGVPGALNISDIYVMGATSDGVIACYTAI